MIDVNKLLYEICEDESVYDDNFDLIENGVLDSFAFIELFARFEDYGINIQPTQIDRNRLKTPGKIKELIEEYNDKLF